FSSSSDQRSRTMGDWIMSSEMHDRIVSAAYKKRGYTGKEAAQAAAFSNLTARHGIKTHNAIKALHLDEVFGSKAGGCVPGATIGFPICIDWATSTVAMGRVQQFVRENKPLPPGCAVDEFGKETTDATKVKALLPFGAHKGYGLSLIDELVAAFIGGSLPTLR